MRRRLLNPLTALSLALCLAVSAAWPLSYRGGALRLNDFPAGAATVEQAAGRLRVVVPLGRHGVGAAELLPLPRPNLAPGEHSTWSLSGSYTWTLPDGRAARLRDVNLVDDGPARSLRASEVVEASRPLRLAGCEWRTGRRSVSPVDTDATPAGTFRNWAAVAFPHGYLLLAAAVLPALHADRAIRRRLRTAAGHCPRCGYDLRATPGRCPECGTRDT